MKKLSESTERQLKGIYMDDSVLVGISVEAGALILSMEFSLSKDHPSFISGLPNNDCCTVAGRIIFDISGEIVIKIRKGAMNQGVAGEVPDYGSINGIFEENDGIRVDGDWGAIWLQASNARVIS